MAKQFYLSTRLFFGAGARQDLGQYITGHDRLMVITDAGLVKAGMVDTLADVFSQAGCQWQIFSDVPANPHADVVEKALVAAKDSGATAIIALGGGSPMDVAKVVSALAVNGGHLAEYQWEGRKFEVNGLPLYALPTTAGTGSEVTKTAVIIDRNEKKGIVSEKLLPLASFIDPELMVSLPPHITASTGMDALTHAIEALVAKGANPFTDAWATEAIKLLGKWLRRAYSVGDDLTARAQVAVASTLAGAAMDQAGLGIIHAIAGPLSSYYDVPHGLANAVVLPWGMEFNMLAVPERYALVATLLGVKTGSDQRASAQEAIEAVRQMQADLEIPETIESYLKNVEDIPKFAREAAGMFLAKANPRLVMAQACTTIFNKIFAQ